MKSMFKSVIAFLILGVMLVFSSPPSFAVENHEFSSKEEITNTIPVFCQVIVTNAEVPNFTQPPGYCYDYNEEKSAPCTIAVIPVTCKSPGDVGWQNSSYNKQVILNITKSAGVEKTVPLKELKTEVSFIKMNVNKTSDKKVSRPYLCTNYSDIGRSKNESWPTLFQNRV